VLKEIHVILKEILASFLPGRAKDLSAPPYLAPDLQWNTAFPTQCTGMFMTLNTNKECFVNSIN